MLTLWSPSSKNVLSVASAVWVVLRIGEGPGVRVNFPRVVRHPAPPTWVRRQQ